MLALTPVVVPLATALVCALLSARARAQLVVSTTGALVNVVCASLLIAQVQRIGTVSVAVGNWPLPMGIEFLADRLGAVLVLIAAVMLSITVLWQRSDVDPAPATPALHPLLHGLTAGVGGAFVTADLFNLYVWFEVALICSLGLLVQGGALRNLDATFKYFAINVLGTLLLLVAISLIYAATGQLNMRAIGQAAAGVDEAVMLPLTGLLLIAFLMKAAAFPFFAWLPVSYHTLPAPVAALFSALLTKVGICAIFRIMSDVFDPPSVVLTEALGWIAVLSMVTGALGAAYHWDMRRILAFHGISQIGYILLGIAMASQAGDAAAVFFTVHHSLVKASLFLLVGLVFAYSGHYDLRRIGGLYAARPGLSVLFLLMALTLIGTPPLNGFWGKYLIVSESFAQEHYLWGAAAVLVSMLTLYSMLKMWMEAFWKPHPDRHWRPKASPAMAPSFAGVTVLVFFTVGMGLFPNTMIDYAQSTAAALRETRP